MRRFAMTTLGARVVIGTLLTAYAAADQPPLTDVRVDSMELTDIGSESLEVVVQLAANANASATLRNLSFDQLTINDLRLKAPIAPGPVTLRQGEAIRDLPPLRTTLMYRELESLEPLRRMLGDGAAHVKTTIRAQLELNVFQRLALMGRRAWVITRVDQTVPVEIPGGPFGRFAGLAAMAAAEPFWSAGQAMRETRRAGSEQAERARDAVARSLVALETRYDLRSRGGEVASMRYASAGIVVSRGVILAPAEAVEPWAFDESVAEAIESREVSVIAPSLDIVVTTIAVDSAPTRSFSLRAGEMAVRKMLRDSETVVSPKTRRRFPFRFRGSDANAALLEVRSWDAPVVAVAARPDQQWRFATVFTPRATEQGHSLELWHTEARYADGRYEIKDPLDAAAVGSGVWIGEGMAGLVQDGGSAADIARVMKRLAR